MILKNKIIDIYRATLVSPPPEMGGDPYPDWDNPTLIASIPASVQPLHTDERLVYRDIGNLVVLKVYCRKVDVLSSDQVKIDQGGDYWQVSGDPFEYKFQGTSLHYVKFYIQQVRYDG